ncbi:unnamed protein product [Rhodiola kirilowii]
MSSNSPCAACKFQRRKCTPECIFAPYFPPEDPEKFVKVHKVFGGSNVSKILSDLNPAQREDAAKSLAYEAEARLRDPIYGCVGFIAHLQQRLKQLNVDLINAKEELASYVGLSATAMASTVFPHPYGQMVYHPQQQQQQMMGNPPSSPSALPYTNLIGIPSVYTAAGTSQQQQAAVQMMMSGGNPSSSASAFPYTSNLTTPCMMMGAGASAQAVSIGEQHQQQYGAVATTDQHELMMMRNYELQQQQQQQDYFLFKSSDQYEQGGGQVVNAEAAGFIQMAADETCGGPSLALGVNYDNPCNQIQQQAESCMHHALQAQLVLQSPQHPELKAESDEGRSAADPSC